MSMYCVDDAEEFQYYVSSFNIMFYCIMFFYCLVIGDCKLHDIQTDMREPKHLLRIYFRETNPKT